MMKTAPIMKILDDQNGDDAVVQEDIIHVQKDTDHGILTLVVAVVVELDAAAAAAAADHHGGKGILVVVVVVLRACSLQLGFEVMAQLLLTTLDSTTHMKVGEADRCDLAAGSVDDIVDADDAMMVVDHMDNDQKEDKIAVAFEERPSTSTTMMIMMGSCCCS